MHRDALDPAIIDAAAEWFVTLSSGVVSADEHAAFTRWRLAHTDHDRAWRRFENLGQSLRDGTAHVPVATARQVLQTANRRLLDRRRMLKTLLMAGVAVPAAWLLREQTPLGDVFADYRTAVGERRSLTLADGTQLQLNTTSAVDVRFDARQRQVILRQGEIQIATAADVRPLVVITRDGSLRPIGTRFAVRRLDRDEQTRLAVSEGRVEVRPRHAGASPVVVEAGEQVRFGSGRVAAPIPLVTTDNAWTDGMLGAERMRLGDFIEELARHRPGLLRCEPSVAGLRLTGTYPLKDTDLILAKLEQTLPVRVVSRSRYWVTVVAR